MIARALILLASCVALACGSHDDLPQPATPPSTAVPSALAGRTIAPEAKQAMKDQLAAQEAGRKAWILSQPGNPEAAALAGTLASVFRDAGWQVTAETASGFSLKPGLMVLIAEEQYPPYVDTVVGALQASGLDAKSASGYRGYYDAKKKENPAWPGIPLRADQDFVIVVGPKPEA